MWVCDKIIITYYRAPTLITMSKKKNPPCYAAIHLYADSIKCEEDIMQQVSYQTDKLEAVKGKKQFVVYHYDHLEEIGAIECCLTDLKKRETYIVSVFVDDENLMRGMEDTDGVVEYHIYNIRSKKHKREKNKNLSKKKWQQLETMLYKTLKSLER